MRIIGFSINPLFEDRVIGGSAKHQRNVLVRLGELGHDVTVLCTRLPESRPFRWHDRVEVLPLLPFKQPFPQPYAVPAYQLAEIAQTIADHLDGADRFYMHDGELLLPYLYRDVPTVISLRDNVYPETILGSFLFAADRLIAIAEYSRQVYLHTAGRFLPELARRTVTVNNGIDFSLFRPGELGAAIRALAGVDPARHLVVLHPHRPEETKGLAQTVAVAELLVRRYGCDTLRVLVPRWFDEASSPEVRAAYAAAEADIAARGLREHFIFHDWVPQRLMPDYYRLGHLTLVLGSFVEAFGNVAYESLACGTPAIVARVATHRSLLPDDLIAKVHYDDNEAAAALAAAIVRGGGRTSAATMAYLRRHFAIEDQLDAYADAILGARRVGPPATRARPLGPATRYGLPPWCYTWGDGMVFHDFLARHAHIPALSALAAAHPGGFDAAQAAQLGVSPEALAAWRRDGYLSPLPA
ncbi:glycosyltransferase family 4 protein [Oscillochloris sp. ZM17-4]|uniref:glycosyltransferase family 4 protein n=1 Tax=Oscillochloris sp. ZM17-4 TaxID=2866714 RepID=UPI001C72D5EC|nr:glycosyltransferase family 4 protein [Oscillochloris sp. ZM17-4]MBX0331465.1 glycosyltransferase family 4 protein [Oscillochloris sp. ZM17-4]